MTFQLVTNTSKEISKSMLITLGPGTPILVSPASPDKSHVIVQAAGAGSYFVGNAASQAFIISGDVSSKAPNSVELRTQGDVYVTVVAAGTVSVLEFSN